MIKFVTGTPGEGKTAYAVRFIIVPTLLETNQTVVTNIKVYPDEIKKYIESQGGEFDPTQLILLPDAKNGPQQFTFRTAALVHGCNQVDKTFLEELQESDYFIETQDDEGIIKATYNKTIDYVAQRFWEACPPDCQLVFDEAAEYLNSIDLGQGQVYKLLSSYARLHRHLGHEVTFCVQNKDHVGKQTRDMAQDEITLYNFHLHPILWVFRVNMFLIRQYNLRGHRGSLPKMDFVRYDKKIFELYDTHQHSEFHETQQHVRLKSNKKLVKKSAFKRFKQAFFGKPLFWILLFTAISLGYAFWSATSRYNDYSDNNEKKQTNNNDEIPNTNTVLPSTDFVTADSATRGNHGSSTSSTQSSGFLHTTPPPATQSTSTSARSTFSRPTVRGFELRTAPRVGTSSSGE